MTSFSRKLIEKCQKVFKQRSGVDIDIEQAEFILERLAKIGHLAVRAMKQESRQAKKANRVRGP